MLAQTAWVFSVTGAAGVPSWTRRHAGLDCKNGTGAVDLENPPGSSLGLMGLDECLARCRTTPNCTGVTTDVVNLTWVEHKGVNCYAGHGATELIDGDGTVDSCFVMTLAECRSQCVLTPGCTGIEWNSSNCCLRSNIELADCDTDSEPWSLHQLVGRAVLPPSRRPCRRRSSIDIGQCDSYSEGTDTYVIDELPREPWWLTTNFAERSFMPRHWSCNISTPNKTCTLRELTAMLPSVQEQGYTVVNIDWPVEASPDSLYEGFGAKDYWNVDPALGTDDDWTAFVADAHARGLRVVADFNPSYFWTGAPSFQQAVKDVAQYGLDRLPVDSPARWFRWTRDCDAGSMVQPPDAHPKDGVTNAWVRSPAAGGACYYSIWGTGQPCGDLASPEWQAELTRIIEHWVTDRGLDGFMLDAPGFYLAAPPSAGNPISGLHDSIIGAAIRKAIVEPAHALGAAVFGETYNLLRPSTNKMLDGGRNTDMPNKGNGGDSYPGFPGLLHGMVVAGDASKLEALLQRTVDVLGGWSGGAVRTEPDSRGDAKVAGLKAAVTALVGTYYVVRMGNDCHSPYPSYPKPSPGDEWPGGCFGSWAGADAVSSTLKALPSTMALRPGSPRLALNVSSGGKGVYAALRTTTRSPSQACNKTAAVIAFNFASSATTMGVELKDSGIVAPQTTRDIINGKPGPAVPSSGPWKISLPAYGWTALEVQHQCSVE